MLFFTMAFSETRSLLVSILVGFENRGIKYRGPLRQNYPSNFYERSYSYHWLIRAYLVDQ